MSYFQDFPNTNFYNQDLGWLIKKYKELDGDVKVLQQIYDMIKNQIKDITLNQLKEWLDDGTLENMIMSLGQIVKYFDTTENMIMSNNLQVGQVIKTLGYSSINDGGEGLFYIVNSIDDDNYQFSLGNGLYATLIIQPHMNITSFGISSNNTDDSSKIQRIFNLPILKEIDFNNKTFYIKKLNLSISINNVNFIGINDSIEYTETDTDNYMLLVSSNVTIKNSSFNGNRHYDTKNYGYFPIKIDSVNNVCIENCSFQNSFKFPIYINKSYNVIVTKNIIYNVYGNYGDGIFITSSHDINVSYNDISYVDRIGIVSEGTSTNMSYDINFISNYCHNINNGIGGEYAAGLWYEHTYSGMCLNNKVTDCKDYGMRINPTLPSSISSNFTIENNVFENNGVHIDLYTAPYLFYCYLNNNIFKDSSSYSLQLRNYCHATLINNVFDSNGIYINRETQANGINVYCYGNNLPKITIDNNMPELSIIDNYGTLNIISNITTFNRFTNSFLKITNSDVSIEGSSLSCNNCNLLNSTVSFESTNVYVNTGKISNCIISGNFLTNANISDSIINDTLTLETTEDLTIRNTIINSPINIPKNRKLILINCGGDGSLANVTTGATCSLINCYTSGSSVASGGGTINKNNSIENVTI